jgi:hypothetical protein
MTRSDHLHDSEMFPTVGHGLGGPLTHLTNTDTTLGATLAGDPADHPHGPTWESAWIDLGGEG